MDLSRLTGVQLPGTAVNRSLLSLLLVSVITAGSFHYASLVSHESERRWLLAEASKYEAILQTELQHLIDLIYRSADQAFSPDTPAVTNSFPWVRSIGMLENPSANQNQTRHQLLTLSLSEVSQSLGGQITFAIIGDTDVLLVLSKAEQRHTIQAIFSSDKLLGFVNERVNSEDLGVSVNVGLATGTKRERPSTTRIHLGLPGLEFDATLSESQRSERSPSDIWPLTLTLVVALWAVWLLLFFERQRRTRHLELIEEQKIRIESQAGRSALAEITSTIGHEINQPIAAIETLSDTACLLIQRDRNPEAIEKLREIQRESIRVGQIVNTIRRLSSTGKLRLERIDLAETVLQLEPLAKIICKDANLSVAREDSAKPAWITADRTGIEQVLLNLISNAYESFDGQGKHKQSDDQITVLVTQTDNEATVTVTDNGPGIVPEIQNEIFQSLVSTKPYGVGLGLSLSRSIIEKHHGRLSLAKSDASGTRFELRLPLARD